MVSRIGKYLGIFLYALLPRKRAANDVIMPRIPGVGEIFGPLPASAPGRVTQLNQPDLSSLIRKLFRGPGVRILTPLYKSKSSLTCT